MTSSARERFFLFDKFALSKLARVEVESPPWPHINTFLRKAQGIVGSSKKERGVVSRVESSYK